MGKGRMEAFSDGVIAIILTIMVLDLKAPKGADFEVLKPLLSSFFGYILSFIYIGIYWNNHHHLLQSVKQVRGAVLWANLHLLFWLSLVPFATAWMGDNCFTPLPVAMYGVVLLMAGAAYSILVRSLLKVEGPNSLLAKAIGKDFKGNISVVLYACAIGLSFVEPWMGWSLYILVAVIWLIPDSRIEKNLASS